MLPPDVAGGSDQNPEKWRIGSRREAGREIRYAGRRQAVRKKLRALSSPASPRPAEWALPRRGRVHRVAERRPRCPWVRRRVAQASNNRRRPPSCRLRASSTRGPAPPSKAPANRGRPAVKSPPGQRPGNRWRLVARPSAPRADGSTEARPSQRQPMTTKRRWIRKRSSFCLRVFAPTRASPLRYRSAGRRASRACASEAGSSRYPSSEENQDTNASRPSDTRKG